MLVSSVNVIGHISANLGTSIATRNFIKYFISQGVFVYGFDIDKNLGFNYIQEFGETNFFLPCKSPDETKSFVNIYVFGLTFLTEKNVDIFFSLFGKNENSFDIVLPYWELPVIPPHYANQLSRFDLILSPSYFVKHAIMFSCRQANVIDGSFPNFLPDFNEVNRSFFSLPEDKILYYVAFDPFSDIERKNIIGAISAFELVESKLANAILVIKVNKYHQAPEGVIEKIQYKINGKYNIILIKDSYSYSDLFSLYNCMDVFISLHRSEGFGMLPFEGMSLGKPVIATNWSGNLDFMDINSSCLIPYSLIDINGSLIQYKKDFNLPTRWADPDIRVAAAWMSILYNDKKLRLKIGVCAKNKISEWNGLRFNKNLIFNISSQVENKNIISSVID